MIGLLDTPTEGEYYINGKLVDDLTDDEMSVIRNEEIGFIFQGFNLIPSLTALENVELPLVYRGMKKDERRNRGLRLPVLLRQHLLLFLPMSRQVTSTLVQQRM